MILGQDSDMAERLTDHRYRTIDPTKLILTISKMADRVEEHFPASGLSSVANEVAAVAEIKLWRAWRNSARWHTSSIFIKLTRTRESMR